MKDNIPAQSIQGIFKPNEIYDYGRDITDRRYLPAGFSYMSDYDPEEIKDYNQKDTKHIFWVVIVLLVALLVYLDIKLRKRRKAPKKENPKPKTNSNYIVTETEAPMSETAVSTSEEEVSIPEKKVSAPKKEITINLPPVYVTPESETINPEPPANKFVNYTSSLQNNENSYPVIKIPKKGCIVRTHYDSTRSRRGYKEEDFQNVVSRYFSSLFIVTGNVRLNTGKTTKPYEPDIAMLSKTDINIRIDIEIDEPYSGISRVPIHCKGDDLLRNNYFVDRGWIVLRFSEYQVHTQENECLKQIALLIKSIIDTYEIPDELEDIGLPQNEDLWDTLQAQKWEKSYHRENYLEHQFNEDFVQPNPPAREFYEQDIIEDEYVTRTIIGEIEDKPKIGFNERHSLESRDNRVTFYPEEHIYTIDNNIPVTSVSTTVSKFFPEFDTPYWSRRKAIDKLTAEGQELTELNIIRVATEIADGWKERGEVAAQEGRYLHEQIEKYYLNQPFERTDDFHLFEEFINDYPDLNPYRSEWRIFDEDYQIAGTVDLIVQNGNSYDLYDWKRSKKVVDSDGNPITDNPFQCGTGSLCHIDDTSYNRYCLQLNIYRYILEKHYNLTITNMYLVVLHPNYDTYYRVPVQYLEEEVITILKTL